MRISEIFLNRTRTRDKLIFLLFAVLHLFLFQFAVIADTPRDFSSITFLVILGIQFYFAAFIIIPVKAEWLRWLLFLLLFIFNFFLFRQMAHALLPLPVRAKPYFELILVVFFSMTLIGRNIRMYISLIDNLERLNLLRLQRHLFSDQEKISLNFGHEGTLELHPNEIVYIRTKTAGDHTKIFGIKRRKSDGQHKMVEYETSAYQNFNEIFKQLAPFPQFKRISQSTVLNFKYPYEEKKGSLLIESRRFAVSPKYKTYTNG